MRTGRPGETGGTATGDTPDGWEASDRSDRPGKIRLPGDSLLFTAGFLASQGVLQIVPLALLCCIAAVVGDSTGYAIGAVGCQLKRVSRKVGALAENDLMGGENGSEIAENQRRSARI